jgi:hypothetical protein
MDVLDFARKLGTKPVYSVKQDLIPKTTSTATAYRYLKELKDLGIVKSKHGGHFIVNTSVISHKDIFQELLPGLRALNKARRFGREYTESDIKFAMSNIPYKLVTLDYKAWELTKFQYPSDLYLYVDDVDKTVTYLKHLERRFKEGKNGRVVILPVMGEFENEIQRVYLDCIAKGGRSLNDAIAIELLYGDSLTQKAQFSVESVLKVKGELPAYDVTPTTT